jgi:signal transduction protein with GAF and PtsI domain
MSSPQWRGSWIILPVTAALLTHRDLIEAAASVRELFDSRTCVVAVVDVEGEHLEFVAGDGAGAHQMIGVRLKVGEGIAGYVAQAGVPVEVRDLPRDERWVGAFSVSDEFVPDLLLAVPLVSADGRVIGVLQVLDPSPQVAAEVAATVGGLEPVLALVAAQVAGLVG